MRRSVVQTVEDIEAQAGEEQSEKTLGAQGGSSSVHSSSLCGRDGPPASWISNTLQRGRQVWRHVVKLPEVLSRKAGLSVNIRNIHDGPEGYPRLAAFLDSDDQFGIYRRFGYVQSRLLLEKQNELQSLEKRLADIDKAADHEQPGCLKRAEMNRDNPSNRKKHMLALESCFNEYAQLVGSAKELSSTARPSESAYTSFRNFFWNTRPLCQRDER